MKTTRSTVPALLVLTMLVGVAIAIGLLSRGGQGQPDQPDQPADHNGGLVDNGPNAGLSNEELLSLAITNMVALKSYHLDFTGGLPYERTFGITTSTNLSMTADIQSNDRGSRFTFQELSGGSLFPGIAEVGSRADAPVTANNEGWYESYDSGATWRLMEGEVSFAGFLVVTYGCTWGPPCADSISYQQAAAMIAGMTLRDGSPRIEQQEGTNVRHIVADLKSGSPPTEQQDVGSAGTIVAAFEDTTVSPASPTGVPSGQYTGTVQSADFWVSTGITPTIRQWRIGFRFTLAGETSARTSTLTWKWSRFNESFGEVKPPPQPAGTPTPVSTAVLSLPYGPLQPFSRENIAGARELGTIPNNEWGPGLAFVTGWETPTLAVLGFATTLWQGLDGTAEVVHQMPQGHTAAKAISPDGQTVLSYYPPASDVPPNSMQLLRVSDGALLHILSGHTDSVLGAAFSPDGRLVATGGYDAIAIVWRVEDGTPLYKFALPPEQGVAACSYIDAVAFSPDSKTLAVGWTTCADSSPILLWRLSDGSLVGKLDTRYGAEALAFSPDGQSLAAAAYDLFLFRVVDGTLVRRFEGDGGSAMALAFSPGGDLLASAGAGDGAISVCNVATGERLTKLTGHKDEVRSLVYSPDGKLLASSSKDYTVRIWGVR